MHNKPTYDAQNIHTILARMESNGSGEPEDTGKREAEEPEEFDVYIEPDRITVVKRKEPQAQVIESKTPKSAPAVKPEPAQYFALFACFTSLLLIVYLVTTAFFLTFFPPAVTVTLLMNIKTITTNATIQLPARAIPPITLSQTASASATGKGHQDAKSATGYITFYNGQFSEQFVPAGKVLTGSDGIAVMTDQDATIPAGNPPAYGQVTVSAHTVSPGTSENIQAYDINQPCCFASVLAKNTSSFTGGQNARDYTVVTQADVENAVLTLKTSLTQSMHGALEAQVKQTETLIPVLCNPTVIPDHQAGQEAKEVTVTVSETCSGIVYDTQALAQKARTILATQATHQLGTSYRLLGDVQASILQTTVRNTAIVLKVRSQGTWGYSISPVTEERLLHKIAGKTKQDALTCLVKTPGIQAARIAGVEESQKLPKSVSAIHLVIIA